MSRRLGAGQFGSGGGGELWITDVNTEEAKHVTTRNGQRHELPSRGYVPLLWNVPGQTYSYTCIRRYRYAAPTRWASWFCRS